MSMEKNSVAIVGESRLAQDLHGLCREKGVASALLPQLSNLAPDTPIVIETCAGDAEKKKPLLQKLDAFLAHDSVIITSWATSTSRRVKYPESAVRSAVSTRPLRAP